MPIISFIAVYIVIWALVLQAVLPFGVRTQSDAQEIVPGTEPSAPLRPRWGIKMIVTTLIALVLWGVFYWVYSTTGLGIRG